MKSLICTKFAICCFSFLLIAVHTEASAQEKAREVTSSLMWGWNFDRVDNKAFVLWGARWRQTTIPVCWENPDAADDKDLDLVKLAIEESWAGHSCLEFTGWKKCAQNNSGIRVLIDEDGPHAKALGRLLDGVRNGVVLNFNYQTWSASCRSSEARRKLCNKSIAVHEWGHALAFAHEQNRWNTPAECTQPPQGTDGDVILTDWDPDSVMNYCNPVYNNRGILSDLDIEGLHKTYCAPGESLRQ